MIWYRLAGSPLDTSAESAQVARENLWANHNERFKPKLHKQWLEDGPAGGGSAWSGTGDGAAIRREAALGNRNMGMPERKDALIATYESPETFMADDKDGGANKNGGKNESSMVTDGIKQQASKEEITRLSLAQALRVNPPAIKYSTVAETRVCTVGDPKLATIHVVTVHDFGTSYRSGLLQFSVEMCALMELERSKATTTTATPRPCFYHFAIPGHDVDDTSPTPALTASDFKMDALASRVNRVVAGLDLSRFIFFGEGAGANIVIRAASEDKQRESDDFNKLKKRTRQGGLLTGIAVLNAEFNGPTLGDGIFAGLGHWLMTHGYLGVALGRFGVQEWVSEDPSYLGDFEMMNMSDVAKYAYSYMHHDQRQALAISRTRVLENIPNLVMVGEGCEKAKNAASRVCSQLDQIRGSGVVPLAGHNYCAPAYCAGGGCILKDKKRRENAIEVFRLFIEAA